MKGKTTGYYCNKIDYSIEEILTYKRFNKYFILYMWFFYLPSRNGVYVAKVVLYVERKPNYPVVNAV